MIFVNLRFCGDSGKQEKTGGEGKQNKAKKHRASRAGVEHAHVMHNTQTPRPGGHPPGRRLQVNMLQLAKDR